MLNFLPYHETAFVLIVRAEKSSGEGYSLFGGITDKLRDTLITDGRYRLILSGMGTTVLVSLLSGVLGLLAAFGMVSLNRMKRRWISRLIAAYCRVIAGLPVVVILMLLYYVVFASSDISSTLVAVIGFTMIFAPKAYALISNAVDAIDRGQMEGALALGYTEKRAFRRIILPQARKIYFPLLKTQFSLLIKETSVVGYITVTDLTRAGDIIRGHTLEAFVPLLLIALIYFFLTWGMATAIEAGSRTVEKYMEKRTDK